MPTASAQCQFFSLRGDPALTVFADAHGENWPTQHHKRGLGKLKLFSREKRSHDFQSKLKKKHFLTHVFKFSIPKWIGVSRESHTQEKCQFNEIFENVTLHIWRE
jgi:hypothetical protein